MKKLTTRCAAGCNNNRAGSGGILFAVLTTLSLTLASFAAADDSVNLSHNESMVDHARQATITVDGESTIHTYTTPFRAETNATEKQLTTNTDRQVASYNPLLWIFDVSLNLHSDYDHDGHYSNFSLTLDLDTSLAATTVYAILYLANDGGHWNEYAVTGNFTVSGAGSSDTFSLTAELDSGYPSGYYNHYIEVYDAYSHELIGNYGPTDSHQLYGLPIESRQHDTELQFDTDLRLSFSGTGPIQSGPLFVLAGYLFYRRRRQQKALQGQSRHPGRQFK